MDLRILLHRRQASSWPCSPMVVFSGRNGSGSLSRYFSCGSSWASYPSRWPSLQGTGRFNHIHIVKYCKKGLIDGVMSPFLMVKFTVIRLLLLHQFFLNMLTTSHEKKYSSGITTRH